jgi:hypothetical protein
MGRPSKLDERQWAEIGRRLAQGEKAADLAKEFKVSRPTIVGRFSNKVSEIRSVANALASAEMAIERMPVSDAMSVRALADSLKQVGGNLVRAAKAGSDTSALLAEIANQKAARVVGEDGKVDGATIAEIAVLTEASNSAAKPALKLVTSSTSPAKANESDEVEEIRVTFVEARR